VLSRKPLSVLQVAGALRERGASTVPARSCATLNRMPERKEFQEIGHCGGQFIVEVGTETGQRGVSFGVTHSRPVPASLVAIYALPQGIPVGMVLLAGIGEPFNPPPHPDCFHIFIASDSQGLFGHECPSCSGYWRSDAVPAAWEMTCPYCGLRGDAHRFLTAGQCRFVEALCALTREAIESEKDGKFKIDMDNEADKGAAGCRDPEILLHRTVPAE